MHVRCPARHRHGGPTKRQGDSNPTVPQSQLEAPGHPWPLPTERAEAETGASRKRGPCLSRTAARAGAEPAPRRPSRAARRPARSPALTSPETGGTRLRASAAPRSGALGRPLAGNAPGSPRRCGPPPLGRGTPSASGTAGRGAPWWPAGASPPPSPGWQFPPMECARWL